MPGLNSIITFNKKTDPKELSKILDSINFDSSYFHESIYGDSNLDIFFSGYNEYPRQKIELGDKTLIIEGAIYNKSTEQVKAELGKILPQIAAGQGKTNALRDFMFNTDGEYIIYYIDKALSTIIIFNDALGRLPAYCHFNDNGVILARSARFLVENLPAVQFDENYMMEYFLFSAPLGNHTFFKGITRLMPCTLIVINLKSRQIKKEILYNYSFDDRLDDHPIEEYVKTLHDLFLDGVSNRASLFKDRKQVLSLSGGLDSRAILMAMLKKKIKFEAITFRDYFNLLGRDYPVVKTLEKTYNLDVKAYKLIEDNIPYFERMVAAKDGNSMMGSMGSVLYSMEVIEKEYGKNSVYYVGDEGNYITAPRYSGGKIDSTPQLVKEILLHNSLSVYGLDKIATIFGKTAKEVNDYLCNYFSKYPEKDNLHKVDHYFIWERSFKFTMEGQDRTRLFFWPMAPHYSIPYVRYAFQIKNKYLAGWQIYREFLKALEPKSASIKYANFGIAIDSPMMPLYLKIRGVATGNESLRHNLLVVLRLLKNPLSFGRKTEEWGYVSELKKYTEQLIEHDSTINSYIDSKYLLKLLKNEKYIHKMYVVANLVKYFTSVKNKQVDAMPKS
jgi:asparagine synthase (glutamine-hydrolysing)